MLFDMDVGEIFVIRVAGNIIAPEFVGSIEYAVASFGTQLIVVMGHTKCGAVKATIDNIGSAAGVPTEGIHEIVTRIKPNIFQTCQDCGLSDNDLVTRCVEVNTLSQCEALVGASRLIEKTVAGGSLKIVGSVFDLDSGEVYFCEKDEGEMEVIDSPGR
jgi:carbonic anhydrase